jgi:hypothetical protein
LQLYADQRLGRANVDLTGYVTRLSLVFRATADTTQISGFFVDDANLVSGSTCVAAADTGQVRLPRWMGARTSLRRHPAQI